MDKYFRDLHVGMVPPLARRAQQTNSHSARRKRDVANDNVAKLSGFPPFVKVARGRPEPVERRKETTWSSIVDFLMEGFAVYGASIHPTNESLEYLKSLHASRTPERPDPSNSPSEPDRSVPKRRNFIAVVSDRNVHQESRDEIPSLQPMPNVWDWVSSPSKVFTVLRRWQL